MNRQKTPKKGEKLAKRNESVKRGLADPKQVRLKEGELGDFNIDQN